MSLISTGFDGSVQEPEVAQILAMSSGGGTVADAASWRVTAVAGNRRVAIAPGIGYDAFVYATETASTLLDLTIPSTQTSGGRWFLICAERNWSTNSTKFVALVGSAAADTSVPLINATYFGGASVAPTRIPRVNPSGFQRTAGKIKHQPLAWVYATVGSTALAIVDMRRVPATGVRVSDGPRIVDSVRVPGSFPVAPGANRVFITMNVDVDDYVPVLIEADGRWASPGNSAGSHWIEHNGLPLGPQVRVHNDGVSTMPLPYYYVCRAILKPGTTNTFRFIAGAESSGALRALADLNMTIYEL
jgi:hypothetical protein